MEAVEHGAVRPLEAEMDGLAQRVQDIDRLAELTTLKIQSEPKHRFVEYARLLRQDLSAATVVPVPDESMVLAEGFGGGAVGGVPMPKPPHVTVVVATGGAVAVAPTRNARVQTEESCFGTRCGYSGGRASDTGGVLCTVAVAVRC